MLTQFIIIFLAFAHRCLAGNDTTIPVSFGMIVFPAFEAIDVFGPLESLNMLGLQYPLNLSIIAATLQPVSTKPASAAMNVHNSNFSQSIVPTHTFTNAPPLDVLFVPGGLGTRAPNLNDTINFVKQTYPTLKYFVSICTGAGIAARAGVLDGKRATTNKKSWAATTAWGPNTTWITHARWVVDGNTWTASGVAAGIDATIAFIADVYGDSVAQGIADGMEYVRQRNSTLDPFADLYGL